ncbi:MAG: T9SS type A sorting domain-containing protein [Ignavibacteria bacterium]|nr:T9SS type A sorting domain-containing protein [Ignavibacteria bacterium]
MKHLTVLLSLLFVFTISFSQPLKNKLPVHTPENSIQNPRINNRVISTHNPVLLDTSGTIPRLTQYYDYVTNGNNINKLVVLGDTVIAACDFTDSLNAQNGSTRRTYYQVSFDGGTTWLLGAIMVLNTYSGYPYINPVFVSNNRTVTFTGRGQVTGGAYAATDVILAAGSFSYTYLPYQGSNGAIVSSPLNNNLISCAYSKSDTLYYRTYNPTTNTFSSPPVFVSLFPTNSRYYISAGFNSTNVFVMWWDASANTMKGRASTNSGTTFGSIYTILTNNTNIEGDLVTPWFPADVTYKPGTNTPVVVLSTMAAGNFITAGGCKVLFWSPAINGSQPVKVADWRNMPGTFIADTLNFSYDFRYLQVGMTPLSHPSVAFSSDGNTIGCAFSVIRSDTTSYGFHYNNIYCTISTNNGLNWANPKPISCSVSDVPVLCQDCDEIYPTVSKIGNTANTFHVTYSLSSSPGSTSFTDVITPISKVYQVYKKFCTNIFVGIQPVSHEIPERFSLAQNYPNPFNPSTKINFNTAENTFVILAIYDAAGREVKKLVNQKLDAGIYSVEFNAGEFSSGIYFYSLITEDFVQTKKMVLLK